MDETAQTDRASKSKGLIWVAIIALCAALLAVGIAPLAHAIPWRWEEKIALAVTPVPDNLCKGTPQTRALLQRLVTRLYPAEPGDDRFTIDVRVVKNPAINAYAGLGGRITVFSGLLARAQSPEELAGVLAHEIGHVQHRHVMEAMMIRLLTTQGLRIAFSDAPAPADWTNMFLRLGFSRAQEAQADSAGLRRLQAAHIGTGGFAAFFARMEDSDAAPAFLSDHPSGAARLEAVKNFPDTDAQPVMAGAEWRALRLFCR